MSEQLTQQELKIISNALQLMKEKYRKSEDYLTYGNVKQMMRLDEIDRKALEQAIHAPREH